jgi:peptidyl-prolyl cis-trans isomerase C
MNKALPLFAAGVFAAAALTAQAQNLAKVNGVAIPSARADAMVKELATQGRADNPQLRQMVREELINREIMMQEANRMGLAKLPDIATQLDFARQNVLVRAYVQEHFKKNPITDAEIQGEYDRIKKELGSTEFRARHILVKGEDEAKAIIAKLKGGAKFEELAKQSEDPGSKEKGGDLDWATAATFVPEFSKAMSSLKKGETVEAPVKTQFGFHVIRLDDIRDAKVPSLDEAKPQISQQLQRQRFERMLADLRGKAKVE